MKKRFWPLLVLVLFLLASVCSASAFAAEGVFQFLGGEYAEFADNFSKETPVAVCYSEHTMGGGPDSYLWDPAKVRQLFTALSNVVVGKENPLIATDSDYIFSFLLADGSAVRVCFNERHYLSRGNTRYEVTNDQALWDIPFPCYNGSYNLFTVFDDKAVTDFMEHYEENPAVSVSFRKQGGTLSAVSDPAFAREVFLAMQETAVTFVESTEYFNTADAEQSAFTFAMADGTEHTFTLYTREMYDGTVQDAVAVEPPVPGLETQYYYLDHTDALWALPFPDYETIKTERGITDDLLPLYGKEVETLFDFGQTGNFTVATATRRHAGKVTEEIRFDESEYASASEMAWELSQMRCLSPQADPPDSEETYTFTFLDTNGKTYSFEFVGDYAIIPDANGTPLYYPIRHSAIEGDGVWDIVRSLEQLLAWKHSVNFGGKNDAHAAGKTLRAALWIPVLLVLIAGTVFLVIRLRKRKRS